MESSASHTRLTILKRQLLYHNLDSELNLNIQNCIADENKNKEKKENKKKENKENKKKENKENKENKNKDKSNTENTRQFEIFGIEKPPTIEISPHFPKKVPLFPLFTRPVFPRLRIRLIPNSSPDDLKKTIARIQSENSNETNSSVNPSQMSLSSAPETGKSQFIYIRGPIVITPEKFIQFLQEIKANGESYIALCLVKPKRMSEVNYLYSIGVLAYIEINESTSDVFLTATNRINITSIKKHSSMDSDPFLRATFKELKDEYSPSDSKECKSLCGSISIKIDELIELNHSQFVKNSNALKYFIHQGNYSELADVCAALSSENGRGLQAVLQDLNVKERMKKVLDLLQTEVEVFKSIQSQIGTLGQRRLSVQRDPQKMKLVNEFKEKIKNLKLSAQAQKVFDEELNKLSSLDPVFNSMEHYTCRNYLTWLTSLPWGVYSKDNLDLSHAEKILNEDHYGIFEVKERIFEFLAISSFKGNIQGKILCFVGPPGVGKTSIGQSIARALNRQFFRFSVGGMKDVAEIKGHRRTYIGAMPGKIIQSLKRTTTANPVILIDEIDKLGRGWEGDPSSALLEVLDPQQNNSFLDHYLDVPFDLSQVLFICTANTTQTIPRPLLDRMEIIELSGYFLDEKVQIAKKHLIPQLFTSTGLNEEQIQIDDAALYKLISQYSRDPGVRSLEKQLERIFRKTALKIAKGEKELIRITAQNIESFAGKPKFVPDQLYEEETPPGVVTGLAWNSMGGSLIWIETVLLNKKQQKLKTTGKLGKVIEESIHIAHSVARKFCLNMEPKNEFLEQAYLHVHFPEGAIPKDGPSAGCAIVTSFISLAINKPVKPHLAMTGEITLTGRVLPVGGIKEKIMAAKRNNIQQIILPDLNRRDVEELPDVLKENIQFHFAKTYDDIYRICFES